MNLDPLTAVFSAFLVQEVGALLSHINIIPWCGGPHFVPWVAGPCPSSR